MQNVLLRKQIVQKSFHGGTLLLFPGALGRHQICQNGGFTLVGVLGILIVPDGGQCGTVHFYETVSGDGGKRCSASLDIQMLLIFVGSIAAAGQNKACVCAVMIGKLNQCFNAHTRILRICGYPFFM